jgi:hypothetical protein
MTVEASARGGTCHLCSHFLSHDLEPDTDGWEGKRGHGGLTSRCFVIGWGWVMAN